jgi:hypothetical protein
MLEVGGWRFEAKEFASNLKRSDPATSIEKRRFS